MSRSILHVDMDCFYVSVERLLNPRLEGRAVIVGGPSARGVVSSASYEARAFGVKSAMPMGQALRLCPHAVVVGGSMETYVEYSRRVRTVFEEFSPLVEMASLDEAYIDLSGTERLWGPAWRAAGRLRDRVMEATGLPCSLGLATNKLMAKIASSHAKPKGFLQVLAGCEAAFLAPLGVGALPGVGPRTETHLKQYGLVRIADVARLDPAMVERILGNHGRDLWERANGIHEGLVQPDREPKSIGRSHTFEQDVEDAGKLLALLSAMTEDIAATMRGEGLRARTVTLKLRFPNFETHTAATTLPCATDDDRELYRAGEALLRAHWTQRARIRLLGITASHFEGAGFQLDLFDAERQEKQRRLNTALDAIRGRHGFESIQRVRSRGPRNRHPGTSGA